MFTGLKKSESKRLATLELLSKEDKSRDAALAEFALLACEVMGVEGCFITTFDDVFQYIKYVKNIPIDHVKIRIEQTMCQYSLHSGQMVISSDTRLDGRFNHQPLVKSGHILFYASAPMINKDGVIMGTLCASHPETYVPTSSQVASFLRVATLAAAYLESFYTVGLVDALTGLPNRQFLMKEMERLRHEKVSTPYGLVIFDCIEMPRAYELSRYLGLEALEKLLRSFGSLLRLRLKLKEEVTLYAFTTARYAVLVDIDYALTLAKRAERLPCTQAKVAGDIDINLTLHTGYVKFLPQEDNVQEVVRQGISALHESIRQDIPALLFNPILDHKRNKDFKLLHDLSEAIKSPDQLYMVYQPKISLCSGKTEGVEALLRWKHPQLGNISPAVIVELAEKTTLMSSITQWVIKTVIAQLKSWKLQGIMLPVSINVTVSDFSRPGFADQLERNVLAAGLYTSDLRIECLETEKVLESDPALAELDRLKLLGFTILLDDFGTGYSNISYLRRIPIDVIKLDRSLVSQVTSDTGSRIIARNVIMMLKELQYVVLAEGIEDLETARILEEYGCDVAQGYLFSRPLSPDEIPDWLADSKPFRLLTKIHTAENHHQYDA
ncbi:EAL domain, c-di-GMP-specific phosphodiesterase class I (or its enzymatically inactive variant) [Kosakonia arachidis]|uniref:EAL domain, c-di-GMP-specific phosphodiesterase class I (Or its enzymatically inactive variant) n=1 Tax=Kosakonia arachidis TaxID=551989 RepID=A0A1I6Z907_9ENTR|nr:sensor domain-containing phosphodiesterase [Kosakonia arachidis]SFT59196.1 EAL domain, c-di-GMP-specific phosphodiesterase class I (or its enzymatically inactive variant) [Kosakonia arachidis]